jgi:hypothetical protein
MQDLIPDERKKWIKHGPVPSSEGNCRKEELIGSPELPNHVGARFHDILHRPQDKLKVVQLVKKFHLFMEPKVHLRCPQELGTGPYPVFLTFFYLLCVAPRRVKVFEKNKFTRSSGN